MLRPTPKGVLTCGDTRKVAGTPSAIMKYAVYMELSARDQAIVRYVGLFGQLDSSHLERLLFRGLSGTPIDRALKRLVASKHLSRVGRRAPKVTGGATAYVYELGSNGYIFTESEARVRRHEINHHSLAVGDTYVTILDACYGGHFYIEEPDGFQLEYKVGAVRADIFLKRLVVPGRPKMQYYLEIDRDSERPWRMREKIGAYLHAYNNTTAEAFPFVVFVVAGGWHMPQRKTQIERLIAELERRDRPLFKVCLLDELTETLKDF